MQTAQRVYPVPSLYIKESNIIRDNSWTFLKSVNHRF